MHAYKGCDDTAQVLLLNEAGQNTHTIYEKLKIIPTENPFSCD